MKIRTYILLFLLFTATAVIILLSFLFFKTSRNISKNQKLIIEENMQKASFYKTQKVDFKDIANLPTPVKKYFKKVLRDGQEYISRVEMNQSGSLTIGPGTKDYIPYKSIQISTAFKPGFLWNSTVVPKKYFHITVLDYYISGKGSTSVTLQSIFKVAEDTDNKYVNQGALFRYLAEGVLYPTALLPGENIKWEAVDNNSAIAHFTDEGMSISLKFFFNDNNEVIKIYTEDRYGQFQGKYEQKPWEGHFSDYKEIDGVLIPTKAEIGWHLEDGFWLFIKMTIDDAKYYY